MNLLLDLFLTFAKIGLFTFGGGYAMISIIDHTCVEQKKWITHDEMMNLTVIAESTPGPISINASTYVGYRCAGLWGAVVSTIGMVLPSFVIIFAISSFLDRFLEITIIANAFQGIKMAVGLLILNAGINMMSKMKKTPLSRAILVCAAAAMLMISLFAWNFSSINLLLIAAVVGLTVFCLQGAPDMKGGAGK